MFGDVWAVGAFLVVLPVAHSVRIQQGRGLHPLVVEFLKEVGILHVLPCLAREIRLDADAESIKQILVRNRRRVADMYCL